MILLQKVEYNAARILEMVRQSGGDMFPSWGCKIPLFEELNVIEYIISVDPESFEIQV